MVDDFNNRKDSQNEEKSSAPRNFVAEVNDMSSEMKVGNDASYDPSGSSVPSQEIMMKQMPLSSDSVLQNPANDDF